MPVPSERFDQEATHWDEKPSRIELAHGVAEAVRRQIPLTPSMDLLDFGCGTGLVALALQGEVGSLTGADTSLGMLRIFQKKKDARSLKPLKTLHLTQENAFALTGNFDLILSSMALHHIECLEGVFSQFYNHLKPGGWIALADLDSEDGTFHENNEGVFHLGFDRTRLKALLQKAGFRDLQDQTAYEARFDRHEKSYPIFLITGRK